MELHYDGAYGMNDRIRIESSISTALKMAGFEKKVSLIPVVKTAPVASPAGPVGGGGQFVGLGKKGGPAPAPGAHAHGPGPQGPPRPPGVAQKRAGAQHPS